MDMEEATTVAIQWITEEATEEASTEVMAGQDGYAHREYTGRHYGERKQGTMESLKQSKKVPRE